MKSLDSKLNKSPFIGSKPIGRISKIISEINYLPNKPLNMFKILRMAYSAEKNNQSIAEELVKDKEILARVLNLSSVEEATKYIEKQDFIRAVSSLDHNLIQSSLEIDCARKYFTALKVANNESLQQQWSKAVKTAIIAKAISNWVKYPNIELAFMSALLKTVPALVLKTEGLELEEKIERIMNQGIERKKAEILVRGFTEFEFGAKLLQFYACPNPVVNLMENEFNPTKVENPTLAHIVNFAELVAAGFDNKEQSPSALWDQVQTELKALGLNLTKENWSDKISWLFVKSLEFEESVRKK